MQIDEVVEVGSSPSSSIALDIERDLGDLRAHVLKRVAIVWSSIVRIVPTTRRPASSAMVP
jgi:hypothetical protein